MEENNTLIIEITNQKALGIIRELEELHLIKVLKNNINPVKVKLSGKYRGIISKEEGYNLNEHIFRIRKEWSNI